MVKQLYKAEAKPRTNALSEWLIRGYLRNGAARTLRGGRMTANEMRNDDGHQEGRNDAGHCERCPQQRYREKDRIETGSKRPRRRP